jgi:LPXTG-motif cell wall-anchored protein
VTKAIASNSSFTWVNLVPGVYNVTENSTGLSEDWSVDGEGDFVVVADQDTLATITNHFISSDAITILPTAPIVPTELIPQTGQSTNYGLTMVSGIAAVLLAGVGVISIARRKRFDA